MADTKVLRLSFAETSEIEVEQIHFAENGVPGSIRVERLDIVFLTLGSMTACTSIGSNLSPPGPLPPERDALKGQDGAWELWTSLFWSSLLTTPHISKFGNPKNFYSRAKESYGLRFTVTLRDPEFFERFEAWSGNTRGSVTWTTFKDSNWLISIVIPHQPYFINQPENIQVFWGYALSPERVGNLIRKPMVECTGQEILIELLGLLNFPEHPIIENAITIPCLIPYATSQYLTRTRGDRPQVIPEGSTNLALLGEFVEISQDGVFTMEYSIRAAQAAVNKMMGLHRNPKDVYKGAHNIIALVRALKVLVT